MDAPVTIDELRRDPELPVISADAAGYITAINDRFREAYGWEPADLVGQPLTTIIPRQFHGAHHLGFARFLSTGTPTILAQPLPLQVMTKDGRELSAEHYILAEQVEGAWTFSASLRPLGRTT